jgi:hypothetical protein
MLKPERLFKPGYYNKYSIYQYYYLLVGQFLFGAYYLPLLYLMITDTYFPRAYHSLNPVIMIGLIFVNFYILYQRKTNKEFFSSKALIFMKPLAIIFLVLSLLACSLLGMFLMIETNSSNFQYIESVNIDVGPPKTYYFAGTAIREYRDIDVEVKVINELHSYDMDQNEFELEVSVSGYRERKSFYSEGETTTFHMDGETYHISRITGASINLYKRDGYRSSLLQNMYITSDIGADEAGTISGTGVKPNLSSGYLILILILIILELIILILPQNMTKATKS